MELVYLPVLLALIRTSASDLPATTASPPTPPSWTTAEPSGRNLNGKMFTMNFNKGGISLYAPNFTPRPSSWPVPTSYRYHRYNTARPYSPYRHRGYITPTPYTRYRYRDYITPPPYTRYRHRDYITPTPYTRYRHRDYITPPPYTRYRHRDYITPTPYTRYRYRDYITPTPYTRYRYRDYITPTPYTRYRHRDYITPPPYTRYRHRNYITPTPYTRYRYRDYITPPPYTRYRYRDYITPPPYTRYRYRDYITPTPYTRYRHRDYITPPPYTRYRHRDYITPPPYTRYRHRDYVTPPPYTRYRHRDYVTPTPYDPYKDHGYNTDWPVTAPSYTAQPSTASPPTPTRGVSVCLRFLNDFQRGYQPTVFTLSPSTSPLSLRVYDSSRYALVYSTYSQDNLILRPDIRFWSNTDPEIWTRICVTVDARKNVAQVFKGPDMSIRKMLSTQYVWSGEPVIDFPGFDGQLTDVQVWDYPLRYKEVFNYMTRSSLGSYSGNVLTWSSISYSFRGQALLEDIYDNFYEKQAKQPISSRGRARQPCSKKKKKKTKKFF